MIKEDVQALRERKSAPQAGAFFRRIYGAIDHKILYSGSSKFRINGPDLFHPDPFDR